MRNDQRYIIEVDGEAWPTPVPLNEAYDRLAVSFPCVEWQLQGMTGAGALEGMRGRAIIWREGVQSIKSVTLIPA